MDIFKKLRELEVFAGKAPWESEARTFSGYIIRDSKENDVADCVCSYDDSAFIVAARNVFYDLLEVAESAQVLTDAIEGGFASNVRLDIARRNLNRALEKLKEHKL